MHPEAPIEEFKINSPELEEKAMRKWESESAQINENQITVKPETVLDLENEDRESKEKLQCLM